MRTFKQYFAIVFMFIFASMAQAAVCDFGANYGQIARVYPQFSPAGGPGGTFILLKNGATNALLPGGYYFISTAPVNTQPMAQDQSVYRSMHDLVMEAAKNNWTIYVRTTNCSAPTAGNAQVEYLVVDFP
jgi:hypothetical protein